MFKELLNTEPFNVAIDGATTEWWNIDHRFSITENAHDFTLAFEGEEKVYANDVGIVLMLEKRLELPGLLEDYKLLKERLTWLASQEDDDPSTDYQTPREVED